MNLDKHIDAFISERLIVFEAFGLKGFNATDPILDLRGFNWFITGNRSVDLVYYSVDPISPKMIKDTKVLRVGHSRDIFGKCLHFADRHTLILAGVPLGSDSYMLFDSSSQCTDEHLITEIDKHYLAKG